MVSPDCGTPTCCATEMKPGEPAQWSMLSRATVRGSGCRGAWYPVYGVPGYGASPSGHPWYGSGCLHSVIYCRMAVPGCLHSGIYCRMAVRSGPVEKPGGGVKNCQNGRKSAENDENHGNSVKSRKSRKKTSKTSILVKFGSLNRMSKTGILVVCLNY